MSTKHFINIHQGFAGIYDLPQLCTCADQEPHEISRIGSYGCRTCVCVYVRLDESQCFAGHSSATAGKSRSRCLSNSEAETFENYLWACLRIIPGLQAAVEEEEYRSGKRIAILACPSVRVKGKPASGGNIIAVLRKFFDLGEEIKVEGAHGFGIDHADPEDRQLFRWSYEGVDDIASNDLPQPLEEDPEEMAPERYGWERCFQPRTSKQAGPFEFMTREDGRWTRGVPDE